MHRRRDEAPAADCNRRPDMDAGAWLKSFGREISVELRRLAEAAGDGFER
jgi:hypothetical protein